MLRMSSSRSAFFMALSIPAIRSSSILMQTIDDERMAGMLNAMKKADRLDDILNIASGTDELGQKQIKAGIQQASIGYFPEKYGEWLVPMMQEVMAGKPVPQFVWQGLAGIPK